MDSLPKNKICGTCKKSLPRAEFYKKQANLDALMSICKSCSNEKSKKYYKENRGSQLELAKNRRKLYPEKVLKANRESYARNRDARLARMKKYREENAESVANKIKEWKQLHPDYNKEYRLKNLKRERERGRDWHRKNVEKSRANCSRRRAKKLQATVENFNTSDVLDTWGTDCHICGEPVDLQAPRRIGVEGWELGLHEDHVVPLVDGGSHSLENVKPAHALCNIKKGSCRT